MGKPAGGEGAPTWRARKVWVLVFPAPQTSCKSLVSQPQFPGIGEEMRAGSHGGGRIGAGGGTDRSVKTSIFSSCSIESQPTACLLSGHTVG